MIDDMKEVERIIQKAKMKEKQGVWIANLADGMSRKLESQGYCITHGCNNWTGPGDDRRNQTWVFWG